MTSKIALDTASEPYTGAKLKMDFRIEGMTCSSCSNGVERGIHNVYKNKGLISCVVAILTNSMKVEVEVPESQVPAISAEDIIGVVESIGYSAKLDGKQLIPSPGVNDDTEGGKLLKGAE